MRGHSGSTSPRTANAPSRAEKCSRRSSAWKSAVGAGAIAAGARLDVVARQHDEIRPLGERCRQHALLVRSDLVGLDVGQVDDPQRLRAGAGGRQHRGMPADAQVLGPAMIGFRVDGEQRQRTPR
jgi:hypothetical protein